MTVARYEEQPIACPACPKESRHRVTLSVNGAVDAGAKRQLLDGSLFRFACPACAHVARVIHPELVYTDPALGLVVQLDALGTFDAAAVTRAFAGALPPTTRIVRDGNALMEKVKIADARLDDRLVESVKALARASMGEDGEGKRLLFEAVEGAVEGAVEPEAAGTRLRFTLLSKEGPPNALALPREAYDKLATRLRADGRLLEPGPWAVVDENFARAMLGG